MLNDGGRRRLSGIQRSFQIEDRGLARSLEAVEPGLSRDHYRWAFPVAVVLTVPGPSTLVEAEIAARKRPPRSRTRRNAATFPVRRFLAELAVGIWPPSAA